MRVGMLYAPLKASRSQEVIYEHHEDLVYNKPSIGTLGSLAPTGTLEGLGDPMVLGPSEPLETI